MIDTRCPAAELLAGPPTKGPSVICRVMLHEEVAADSIREGEVGGVLVTDRDHGNVLRGLCCGKGLPRVSESSRPRGHFTFCPVWEAAEAARRERKDRALAPLDKPKILGEDPEVAAGLLGMDPEEMRREERRFAERNPHSLTARKIAAEDAGISTETKTGVEAMEEVANDPEWAEPE